MGQFLGQFDRAQIGEQPEFLPQAEERGTLGSALFGDGWIAVGEAHGAEQNAIRLAAERQSGIRQRFAGGVDSGPADGGFRDIQHKGKPFFGGAEHLQGFTHDFRSNSISGQGGNFQSR